MWTWPHLKIRLESIEHRRKGTSGCFLWVPRIELLALWPRLPDQHPEKCAYHMSDSLVEEEESWIRALKAVEEQHAVHLKDNPLPAKFW